MTLDKIAKKFAQKLADLEFSSPTYYCYNPLEYAYRPAKSYCDKYGTRDSEIDGNAIIIKLSEIYLIRAEALVKKNPQNLTLALADLNVVRQRALPAKPYSLAEIPNLDAFINVLIEENKRELGFEGHQWFTMV